MRPLELVVAIALLTLTAAPATFAQTDEDNGNPSTADTAQESAPAGIDPCQLVTGSEASALTGASYATGQPGTADNGAQTCVYGSQTPRVLMVYVLQAPDTGTAQATWPQTQTLADLALKGQLAPGTFPISASAPFIFSVIDASSDPGMAGADSAAAGLYGPIKTGGHTSDGYAVYLIKGATFVSFSQLRVDEPVPAMAATGLTTESMETQAQTVLARLP